MGERGRRSLVMMDGSLPGLVCCALGETPEELVGWFAGAGRDLGEGAMGSAHREAIEQQGELMGLGEMVFETGDGGSRGQVGGRSGHATEQMGSGRDCGGASVVLLEACYEAARRGCGRVVWGVHCGADLDGVFMAAEQAGLVGRLATLELGGTGLGSEGMRIETPLLDLSESQIAEMALDLDVPAGACWWAGEGMGSEGGVLGMERVRGRWERALAAAGKLRGLSVSVA